MDTTLYIFAIFATYRLARDLVFEDGPFLIFAKFQAWIEARNTRNPKWYYGGLSCPMCLSFWISLILIALGAGAIPWQEFLILWLGVAGGAAFLIKLTG